MPQPKHVFGASHMVRIGTELAPWHGLPAVQTRLPRPAEHPAVAGAARLASP